MDLGTLGEQISTADYKIGIAVGHEDIARLLTQRAGEAFMKGNDKDAIIYRNLAKEIEEMAQEERQEYESGWRPAKDKAFMRCVTSSPPMIWAPMIFADSFSAIILILIGKAPGK